MSWFATLPGGAAEASGEADHSGDFARTKHIRAAWLLAVSAGVLGLALRYLARAYTTADTGRYLLPWYNYAHTHGLGALHTAFTNYTPFYSYLLLIAVQFDGLGQPLSLVKAISVFFELGCAAVAAQMVWRVTRAPMPACFAFCGVWLAPTVLFNGALWGQADSIWAFFLLLSVSAFVQGRNGVPAFGAAFAVKAQGVFLGPFVLGMMLRRKLHWAWLAAIPAIYLVLAIPVLIAGRSLASVLEVYLGQAETFHGLTMNAANVWVFAGRLPYGIGVAAGMLLAAAGGLALSVFMARCKRDGPEFILLAACVSLWAMPYLLPKMHDRYFYAFEITVIPLACLNPRYLPLAVIAQIDGVLAYLAFDRGISMGLLPAALCNTVLGLYLVQDLRRGERGFRYPKLAWLGFAAATVGLFACLILAGPGWAPSPVFMLATGLATAMAFTLLRQTRPAPGAEALAAD